MLTEKTLNALSDFLSSPTPQHAVHSASGVLKTAGFAELDPTSDQVEAGGRGFITRDGTIAAYQLASSPDAAWRVAVAHTDSPNLRLKPNAQVNKDGYRMLNTEVYGGVLWYSWLDRDLAIAGTLFVERNGEVSRLLVDSGKAVSIIPSLAIHLDRQVNQRGLQLNPQSQLSALLRDDYTSIQDLFDDLLSGTDFDHTAVLSWDLSLYDSQPVACSGSTLSGARLDNLVSCHVALQALTSSAAKSPYNCVVILFDHEECGSLSQSGARSNLPQSLFKLLRYPEQRGLSPRTHNQQDFVLSMDAAHALHPNFPDKHDAVGAPRLGGGPVVKTHADQSYATSARGRAFGRTLQNRTGIHLQQFSSRNDIQCGSTVGPHLAASLGLETIDMGVPLLAMHAIRETADIRDIRGFQELVCAFFNS